MKTLGIINKLVLTLPYNLRKSIIFSTLKGDTLLIAFRHPTSVSEFNNYKAKILLQSLEMLKPKLCELYPQDEFQDELNKIMQIKHAKGYIPRNILDDLKVSEKIEIEFYKERSNGDFTPNKNSAFYDIFIQIKKAIKENNESSN